MIGYVVLLAAALLDRPTIALSDEYIRLKDVIDVGPSASVGDRIVARLPDGVFSISLRRSQLRALVVRAAPGIDLAEAAPGSVTFQRPARRAEPVQSCFETAAPILKGARVTREVIRSVPCDPERRAASLAFDRGRQASVAIRALAAGSYLGAVRLNHAPAIERGAALILRSQSGPVTIERPVTARQAAGPASRLLFVETRDGTVIAAPIDTGGNR